MERWNRGRKIEGCRMTAELILQKIQERKKAHFQNILDIPRTGNSNIIDMFQSHVRFDELEQVERIVKDCIAAGEDDGK